VATPLLPPLGADLPVGLFQQAFDLYRNFKANPFPIGEHI
jgi:hypothetical protein